MLAIDIGNTKTALGLFDHQRLVHSWKFRTEKKRLADEFFANVDQYLSKAQTSIADQDALCISSVVPELTGEIRNAPVQTPIHFVTHLSPIDFSITLPNPQTLGPDLISAAQAGLDLYSPPLILVDAGTATTITVVNQKREFIGGAICPGLGISSQALFNAASALSAVTLSIPPAVIGNQTETAVQSGLCRGHAAMIEGLVNQCKQELDDPSATVLITGGAMNTLRSILPSDYRYHPDLALYGISKIYQHLMEG
ncbi:MAG: type III pantothenate kinase [Bdellovibrionota bacterium]